MSAHAPLIRLASVSKRFPLAGGRSHFVAVDDVSLDIPDGQRFGVIGSSGAGKSTLLRLINLLETPDAGRVEIDGRDLVRVSRRDLREARAGIGMIFQQFNLLQNATVYDNVAFPLAIRRPRLSRADQRARVEECLKIVGLSSKLDSYPAQLSGGQKQRVAIARALATKPAVMLCDEPTSALDSETTRSVLDILGDINARLGVTLVIVTHELAVARTLCERVAVMADGRIVEDLPIDAHGDRLETAIARANRGGGGEIDADPVIQPVRRRAGGLPLPAKRTPVVAAGVRLAMNEARALATSVWPCRFPPARPVTGTQARRVGGLPLPAKSAPRREEPLRGMVDEIRPNRSATVRAQRWSQQDEAVHA